MEVILEEKKMENKKPERTNKLLCPFILQPFEGCYCTSTSSLYTEATIYYCGGNFEKCEIYKKHMGQ